MAIVAVEGSLSLTVVDEAEGVVVVFGGKTEGVVGGGGVVRDSGGRDGTRDGTKGSVVIVCCDAIARLKVDKLRHILVAITGIKEFTVAAPGGKERTRGDGFGRIQFFR